MNEYSAKRVKKTLLIIIILFAVIDAGWQGQENYYFQFSLQPSFYIVYQDGYEETSIPENPNQRSAVTDRWTRAKDLTRVLLGFGIYF